MADPTEEEAIEVIKEIIKKNTKIYPDIF